MGLYRKVVLKHAEEDLNRSRDNINEILAKDSKLRDMYYKAEQELGRLYSEVAYWHGTGFFQYDSKGVSKYNQAVSDSIHNVLEGIIKEKGLMPHPDPWVRIQGKFTKSVSTTKFRIYGRLYAQLHINYRKKLRFTYGDRMFFAKFFIHYTLASSPVYIATGIIAASCMKRFARTGSDWARTINSKITSKGNAILDFFNIVGQEKSDIPGNFGLLIGIKEKGMVPARMKRYVSLLESRSTKKVDIRYFTHIEAPLENIDEVKNLLKIHKVKLPVVPLEFGEIYFSKYSINELLG